MTPEQKAAWRETVRRREARLRGEDPDTEQQQAFFSLPPTPKCTAWDIEWRWNKKRLLVRVQDRYPDDLLEETLQELNAFCGENPWQRHRNPKFHTINSAKYAEECLSRLTEEFPGKEFRLTPVRWRDVTEPTMFI